MDGVKVQTIGTKDEVFHGKAKMTRGKLIQTDLVVNAKGKVVSKKAQAHGFNLQKKLQGRVDSPITSIVDKIVDELPKVKDLTVEKVKKPKKGSKGLVKNPQEAPLV